MPGPSETLPALEQRLAERLLAFDLLAVVERSTWANRPGTMTETTEPRAVVSWEGPGQPIVLTIYGPAGEVAVPMVPKRALELAQELLTRGVSSIKIGQWGKPWPG